MREQRGRRGATRRARAEVCWGRGRRLVVVDVENLAGGACHTGDAAAWARRRLRDVGALQDSDQVAVAVDACGLASVVFTWTGARCLAAHGKDGADLALLEVLAERVPQRYDRLVLASGDGIFTEAVADLVAHGVHVTVVSHEVADRVGLRGLPPRTRLHPPGQHVGDLPQPPTPQELLRALHRALLPPHHAPADLHRVVVPAHPHTSERIAPSGTPAADRAAVPLPVLSTRRPLSRCVPPGAHRSVRGCEAGVGVEVTPATSIRTCVRTSPR
jgi:hypothetical protein